MELDQTQQINCQDMADSQTPLFDDTQESQSESASSLKRRSSFTECFQDEIEPKIHRLNQPEKTLRDYITAL